MPNFKHAAREVLAQAGEPLHYKEITERALKEGLISTVGKTPWATMNAQLSVDIANRGEQSDFFRTEPGYFGMRQAAVAQVKPIKLKLSTPKPSVKASWGQINQGLNTKQKGDIAEARVTELLTLYGSGLSCYRPVSDDEGIDIIVKRRGKLEVMYLQVKSSYGYKERGFVSTVKEKNLADKDRLLLIFVYFDLSSGDLFDQIFCIPASKFLQLTANDTKATKQRVFTVGLSHPDRSKYAEYMIEKRELANRVLELMERVG